MKLLKALTVALAVALPCVAQAQTSPNLTYGQVLTPAQWNALLAGKQDFLGSAPILAGGGILTGPLITAASTTIQAGLSLPPGVAPTSPVNGNIWSTSAGFFGQVNGATVGPFIGSSSPSSNVIPNLTVTGSFTATGLVTNADLVNQSTTVNGQTCTLGGACTITASAGTISVGVTTVALGTSGGILYDNAGVLGNLQVTGTPGNVVLSTSPTVSSPTITGTLTAAAANFSGAVNNTGPFQINGNTMTFPATTATLARTDAGQTFSGTNTFGAVNLNAGGTLSNTFSGTPTFSGANFITRANLVQIAALSLSGNPTGSLANESAITLGSTLGFSGTTLNCTTATTSQIGCTKFDNSTITLNGSGQIQAVGAAATAVTALTTTTTGVTAGGLLASTNTGCTGTTPCLADAGGGAPSFPVLHPSSSNLACGQGHVLAWMDQNICNTGDNWIINSTDPSALIFPITIGGSKTTGDVVTLKFTFTFGAINCSAGCNASYTVQSADTLATITTGLMNAIKANASLYNNVAGAQGIVLNLANTTTTAFSMDWNLNAGGSGFTLIGSVSGSATETVSIPSACSTLCPTAFDVNPTIITGRLVSGLAPPNGSQLSTWIVQSNSSASPNAYSVQYGLIGLSVFNSTTGSLDANWTIATTGPGGTTNRAFTIGKHFGDVQDATPTLIGTCGSGGAITSGSTDTDGQATFGTGTPSACTIVFAHSYLSVPRCVVNRQSGTAGLIYNMTSGSISTAGGAASDVVNWHCAGK